MAFYLANDLYSATLSSSYTAGQSTISVNVVPDNVPTLVCVAQGTAKETIFIATGKTINSLTGVSRLKGYEGDLDSGMPVTVLNNEEFVNQYSAAVSTPESLIQILYGIDGGSSDDYVVSLDVAPTAYTAGMLVAFKANTANTGACTLNLNSLGAKSIKVDADVDPATGDIQAGQVVVVVYDGTNFQLQTDVPSETPVYPRAFSWYLDGTSVNGVGGATYIAPQNMTVTKIYGKLTSGTCVATIKKGATTIDAISCSSALATETTITDNAITAGDIITLTVSSASSPVGLIVTMECTQ